MSKICTTLEQSKKLIELGIDANTADMYWDYDVQKHEDYLMIMDDQFDGTCICAWSLAALLKCLSEIKPRVYTPVLFPSEGKWILQFVEYGHGNVCETSYDNPIDACVEMILKLHELNLL